MRTHLIWDSCPQAPKGQPQERGERHGGASGRVDVTLQRIERKTPEPAGLVLSCAEAHIIRLQARQKGAALARVEREANRSAEIHCAHAGERVRQPSPRC